MKLSIAVIATTLAVSQAFMVAPSGNVQTTQLAMDRRELFSSAAALALSGVVLAPQAAFAGDYEPRFDDMKQIYFLGASLDKLVAKLSNPETVEAGMEGVRMFNRDDKFYTGYAKNFILKSIGKGADSDPRVGYVKNASILVGSLEDVMAAGILADSGATKEAINRVKKAQALIAKFLEECGVKDEKFDTFIAAHKM